MRPTSTATTIPIGSSEYVTSSMRCIRRSRIAAMKMIAASFANSDGWTPMPAIPNQRRALLTGALNSTTTSASATRPRQLQMKTGSRYVR